MRTKKNIQRREASKMNKEKTHEAREDKRATDKTTKKARKNHTLCALVQRNHKNVTKTTHSDCHVPKMLHFSTGGPVRAILLGFLERGRAREGPFPVKNGTLPSATGLGSIIKFLTGQNGEGREGPEGPALWPFGPCLQSPPLIL